jgi:septal ring-binding cell division protein DamX
MKCGSQMAIALAGGYLLGHSHKTRLAGLLALLAAVGGELPIDERELLRRTPLGAPLDKLTGDLRTQLVDAGMSVAKKAASSGIESFSDKLQQRATSMRAPDLTKRAEREEAEEPPEEPTRAERPRAEPPRRQRARDEASDDYEDYEDYERDDYEDAEPESARRPPARPARSEPARRAPRPEGDRRRTGRAPR